MGLQAVPWFVGGGAVHSPEVTRLIAFLAANGNEGIVGIDDFKVTQLSTPGAGVAIAGGACAVLNRAANQPYQAYAGLSTSEETRSVALTGGAIRSDMVVFQVKDPWLDLEPWADPADPAVGPYAFLDVIPSVPAASTTLAGAGFAGYTAIPLARIDQPINNTSILNSQIVDLRKLANPQKDLQLKTSNPTTVVNTGLTSTVVDWIASPAHGLSSVTIPPWAVQAMISCELYGARLDRSTASANGTAVGVIRVRIGTAAPGPVVTQSASYDLFAPFADPSSRVGALGAGDTVSIPSAYRGTTQTVAIQASRSGGNKNLYVDTASFAKIMIEFRQVAV